MTEATTPLKTTLKADGGVPWIVIESANTVQLKAQLQELQANGTFAELANASESFKAHFTVGGILGARPINAPQDTGAFAPQQVAAPATQQEQFAQYQAAENPAYLPTAAPAAAPTAPAVAAQYGGGGASTPPGAPLVQGMPAKLVSGTSARGAWSAWADPRPKEMTDHMQKTDDPNDPGLANGTKKLWRFIR